MYPKALQVVSGVAVLIADGAASDSSHFDSARGRCNQRSAKGGGGSSSSAIIFSAHVLDSLKVALLSHLNPQGRLLDCIHSRTGRLFFDRNIAERYVAELTVYPWKSYVLSYRPCAGYRPCRHSRQGSNSHDSLQANVAVAA